MLLELAVFLFLGGVLLLLWDRHRVLFAIATGVVGFAGILYLGTTILPTVDIVRQALQVTYDLRVMRSGKFTGYPPVDFIMSLPPVEYTCPYKSPQAWAVFQIYKFVSNIPGALRPIFLLCRKDYSRELRSAFRDTLNSLSNWSSVDLEIIQRCHIKHAPPFYELNAFRWLVAELRDSPTMIPHLHNILRTLPAHLVMPAVLDQWFFLPHRQWNLDDIEKVLPTHSTEALTCYQRQTLLGAQRETRIYTRLLHWINISEDTVANRDWSSHTNLLSEVVEHQRSMLPKLLEQLQNDPKSTDAFSGIGLPVHSMSMIGQPAPFKQDVVDQVWGNFAESLKFSDNPYLMQLIQDLGAYIIASSPDYALHKPKATTTSSFVNSVGGREFLSKLNGLIAEGVSGRMANGDLMNWIEAMDIVRRVHGLPEGHFTPIPDSFPLPLLKLQKTLNGLSPTDSDVDFQYLTSVSRHWSNAWIYWRSQLAEILSNHIVDYPQYNTKSPHSPNGSETVSPLVMSTAGLDLITFIHNRLAEDQGTYDYFFQWQNRMTWHEAIEKVKQAYPELPHNYFTPILHERIHSPLPENEREAKVSHARRSTSPLHAIEVDDDNPTTGQESLEVEENWLSPAKRRNAEEEVNIPIILPTARYLSGGGLEPGGVGGSDADKNV